jgi:hypothetical protein
MTNTGRTWNFTPGTVIHGSMLSQDIILAELDVIMDWASQFSREELKEFYRPITAFIRGIEDEQDRKMLVLFSFRYAWISDGDDYEYMRDVWFYTDKAAGLIADLQSELEDFIQAHIAPEGYYFGAHKGDGSDIGFWEIEAS